MKSILLLVGVVAATTIFAPDARAQSADAGKDVFRKCQACHRVGEGAKNVVGPMLNGLEGRKSGTVEGYNYSPANKNSGIVWTEAEFLDYIKDPRAKIKGTKMIFPGIKNEKEATDLWAFLKQFGPDGKIKP